MKRFFDIVGAIFGLIALSPLMILVGLVIMLTDGLPVFFRQTRVGLNGEPFSIIKFRSMRVARGGVEFEPGDTNRITPIGRLIRKTKLDELPQLWNVLRGEMSFVGPRPEVSEWVNTYPERWARVHTVRPGITDPAAIAYRNEQELLEAADDPVEAYRSEILPRKLEMYEEYIRTRSFLGDIGLIFKTLTAVIAK